MRALIFLRTIGLLLALAGVIYAIRHVNAETVGRALAVMGIEPGTQQSPGLRAGSRVLQPGEENFNICPTRVHSITWPDGKKVEEKREGLKLTWMAHDPTAVNPKPREISYLAVEKWLSQHCLIAVTPLKADESAAIGTEQGRLTVEMINKSKIEFITFSSDVYRTGDENLRSLDLTQALSELKGIAQFP